jgi:hypothetical protein
MRWTATGIAAAIVTLICWSFFALSQTRIITPGFDAGPHELSGRLMAEQALAALGPGGMIVVFARDTRTFKNPATEVQLESFRKTIHSARAIIGAFHALEVDPLRPIAVPSGEFCQAIRNVPDGCVIVSFMGAPQLNDADRLKLGKITTPIVAFCSGRNPTRSELKSLFDQNLLRAAVVDCRTGAGQSAGNTSKREAFAVVTSNTLAGASEWLSAER